MTLCIHCGHRQAEDKNGLLYLEEMDLCDICREAYRIGCASLDDVRDNIKHANIDVIYMVAKLERSRPPARITMMKMLTARLTKLTGIHFDRFPTPKS